VTSCRGGTSRRNGARAARAAARGAAATSARSGSIASDASATATPATASSAAAGGAASISSFSSFSSSSSSCYCCPHPTGKLTVFALGWRLQVTFASEAAVERLLAAVDADGPLQAGPPGSETALSVARVDIEKASTSTGPQQPAANPADSHTSAAV